ncbi:hypothetical protein BMW24_017340 [Mycobacterium heckeshornense]|uniref:Uncharacterized protein n=1 Tax=Mycobacterium heckeshornense TaxID=110505 RepID=A0A2G8B4P6_9MYCO|nr:hypothetical protein BMW24_017340 [Mycobacterium heckeshornense]BCO34324.1 hypothetical protein MHEC_07570 [Mycobacterium heckeshornense]
MSAFDGGNLRTGIAVTFGQPAVDGVAAGTSSDRLQPNEQMYGGRPARLCEPGHAKTGIQLYVYGSLRHAV